MTPSEDPADPLEPEFIDCRGCGTRIAWTPLYGDWCHVCVPRRLPTLKSNIKFRQTSPSVRCGECGGPANHPPRSSMCKRIEITRSK